jgi:ATP-dependent RNA helicase DeaD
LNRRERRAQERAEREGQGSVEQGETERAPSDEAVAGDVDTGSQKAAPPSVAKRPREAAPARESRPRKFGDDRSERAPARDFGDDKKGRIGDDEVETYRIEVGEVHGVKPGNIVGAIANEAGLEGRNIGRVVIREDHSFVDLPAGMPKEVFRQLQKVRVGGQQLQISRALKTHVEKLRRERPSAPKLRSRSDSRGAKPSARGPRDNKHRR